MKEEMRDLYGVCGVVGRRRILLCATDARAAVAKWQDTRNEGGFADGYWLGDTRLDER